MAQDSSQQEEFPHFVVFEGVDGAGKTTLAGALAEYYRVLAPGASFYAGAFPGSSPGTLGEWVYRLHHGQFAELSPAQVSPPALQLLHVAAHVDTVLGRIAPTLRAGGRVVLDRYWWSTYAYARELLEPYQALALVAAEHPFWEDLLRPEVVYVSRRTTLKAHEIDQPRHDRLAAYYQEVMTRERDAGVRVHELANDGSFGETWATLLTMLGLPSRPVP